MSRAVSSASAWWLALAASWCSGCAGEVAAVVGSSMQPAELVHAARASASLSRLRAGPGPHLGWQVEGRAERRTGTSWTSGVELGLSLVPQPLLGSPGLLVYGEAGFPLSASTADGYVGGTVGVPISIEEHTITERNDSLALIARRLSLVPQVRYRARWQAADDGPQFSHELAGGAALRMQIGSDLVADMF